MAVIKCKMCGDDLVLIEGQNVMECQSCFCRQTVPSADNEKKLNMFASANKLRAACEFDRAAGVYDAIRAEFPSEAEAYWGLVLCKYGIEYVDDPATGRKVPTCHRVSYDSVMEDANLDLALDCADVVARKVYREEAKQLEKIREGILAVSSNEKPYDIFICYKETDANGDRTLDSVLAQDLYTALTEKGYRVFFSRITLQSKLGEAYEPYIFAALNSAKVMLAVGTDPEYYSAVWVKNEWSRYLKICAADKSRHLIPCYKDMDAYDMPREFRPLQGVDLGKMGAVQDILFNMEKYIPLKKQNTTVIQERVVVGGTGGSNKIASLLDRGNMALEDGDWSKADSFFEDVLNNDSKNAQAYIGKALAQSMCRTMDALVRKRKDVYQNVRSETLYIQKKEAHIAEAVGRFSLPGYVQEETIRCLYDFDLSYTSEVSHRQKQYREEESWWQNHRQLSRAEKFAVGAVAEYLQSEKKHLFSQLADRVKKAQEADARSVARLEAAYDAHITEADAKAERLHQDALDRREKDYEVWLGIAKTDENVDHLQQAITFFDTWKDYKDSKNLGKHCRKRINDIKAEQKRKEAERAAQEAMRAEIFRLEKERAAAARKKRNTILGIIAGITAAAIIGVTLLMTLVILPGNKYKAAEALLAEGKTTQAAILFGKAGNYQDARERSFALWETAARRNTLSAGLYHTVGLKTDGTLIATESTSAYHRGQSAVAYWTDIVDVSAGSLQTVGLKADGTVVATEYLGNQMRYAGQCEVDGWTDIVAVSTTDTHTVGLKADGTVVATVYTGDPEYYMGQCEVSEWRDIAAIDTGLYHTVGLKADGTVVVTEFRTEAAAKFGLFTRGQHEVTGWTDITAISAGYFHTVGLKADGTVVAVGDNGYGQCEVSDWTDIVAISAGFGHTVGLKADGTVVATKYTGNSEYDDGRCEVSDWTEIVAVSAGGDHTVGLKADGTVVVTEYTGDSEDYYGQCEVSGWTGIRTPEISEEQRSAMALGTQRVADEQKAEEARLAGEYAAAEELLAQDKTAEAAIAFGKLEDFRDARERSFALWETIVQRQTISAGCDHTVALRTNGTVSAVGNNYDGQCNVSDWRNIIAIGAGDERTIGLKADGTAVGVGIDVSEWKDIVAISAGNRHVVGLKMDGTVELAGRNEELESGMSGWTDIIAIGAGFGSAFGVKLDGTVVAAGRNDYGQCEVSGWRDIVAVSGGYGHTVGLKTDGTVVAVGWNEDGQCEVSDWTDIIAVSAGFYHTVGLKVDGTVVAAGKYKDGQCDVYRWSDIIAISAGWDHTVGLKADGTVVAVGKDSYDRCKVSGWADVRLPANAEVRKTVTGVVNTNQLNIRENPTDNSASVGIYRKNDVVTILEVREDWGRTDLGWIPMQYVNLE